MLRKASFVLALSCSSCAAAPLLGLATADSIKQGVDAGLAQYEVERKAAGEDGIPLTGWLGIAGTGLLGALGLGLHAKRSPAKSVK